MPPLPPSLVAMELEKSDGPHQVGLLRPPGIMPNPQFFPHSVESSKSFPEDQFTCEETVTKKLTHVFVVTILKEYCQIVEVEFSPWIDRIEFCLSLVPPEVSGSMTEIKTDTEPRIVSRSHRSNAIQLQVIFASEPHSASASWSYLSAIASSAAITPRSSGRTSLAGLGNKTWESFCPTTPQNLIAMPPMEILAK